MVNTGPTNELSQYRQKDLITDYQNIENENKARVFEYQNTLIETASILREINTGTGDWKDYREAKNYSLELGREINKNYENHKLYLDQAGITKEKLEIQTGVRNRPLSSVEINAKDRVKLYAKTSEETRFLLRTMKAEEFAITKHEKYETYCDIREIRNDLAKEILANYPIHRSFVNDIAKDYYISKKTMENQVNYAEKGIAKECTNFNIAQFKDILNAEKSRIPLKEDIALIIDKNIKLDRDDPSGKPITSATLFAYAEICNINFKRGNGRILSDHASVLLKGKLGESDIQSIDQETIKSCIKQSLCFDSLKSELNVRELTPELTRDLHLRSEIMAHNLKDDEMHLINDRNVVYRLTQTCDSVVSRQSGEKYMNEYSTEIFKKLIDKEKFERPITEELDEKILKNTKLDMVDLNIPISKTTLFIYGDECGINIDFDKRIMMAKQASEFLKESIEKQKVSEASVENVKLCIKQAFCFEALRSELNVEKLTPQISKEICKGAKVISDHLNDSEMHIINNRELMKSLSEILLSSGKFSHEKIMDGDNLERFTKILKHSVCKEQLKEDINVVMEKNIKLDRENPMGKPITSATLFAYAETCNINFERGNGKTLSDHAVILLKGKIGERDIQSIDQETIKSCIKQSLCFDALKSELNVRELTPELTRDLHLRSEIMAHNLKDDEMHVINNKDLMKIMSGDRTNTKSIEPEIRYDEIGNSICDITNKELRMIDLRSIEHQMSEKQEITPEIQKSRGFELEI